MVLWSLSDEILWPHSVESSSYFRLIEQVSLLVGCCFVQSDFFLFFAYFHAEKIVPLLCQLKRMSFPAIKLVQWLAKL
jgi:hypothetical protein